MALKKSDIAEATGEEQNETFVIGECLFIRTVTHHLVGRLKRISHLGPYSFLHLEEAAWVADDGRFMDCIESGKLNEVEPVTTGIRVQVAPIVDVYPWNHPLPRQQI